MPASVLSQQERLLANVDALAGLLRLADQLRRKNVAKWGLTLPEWQTAVQSVRVAPVPYPDDPAPVAEAIRMVQSAGLRLGDSGEARFASATVGRDPDSSLAGYRFYDDLDFAARSLSELQKLAPAGPGTAHDGGEK